MASTVFLGEGSGGGEERETQRHGEGVAFVLVFVGEVVEGHLVEFIWMHCERGVLFEVAVEI